MNASAPKPYAKVVREATYRRAIKRHPDSLDDAAAECGVTVSALVNFKRRHMKPSPEPLVDAAANGSMAVELAFEAALSQLPARLDNPGFYRFVFEAGVAYAKTVT